MERDASGQTPIQGFATKEVIAVAAGVAVVFDKDVDAFCVPEECTLSMNGGLEARLLEGSIRVTIPEGIYTFGITMNIEVM